MWPEGGGRAPRQGLQGRPGRSRHHTQGATPGPGAVSRPPLPRPPASLPLRFRQEGRSHQVLSPTLLLRFWNLSLLSCHRGTKGKCWHSASASPPPCSVCCILALLLAHSCPLAVIWSLWGPYGSLRLRLSGQAMDGPSTALLSEQQSSNLRPAIRA